MTLRAAADPGLQNERTSLAWRRTALSLMVLSATLAKVTGGAGQVVSLGWLAFGLPGALALLILSSRAYRARQRDVFAVSPWPLIAWSTVIVVGAGILTIGGVVGM